MADCAFKGTPMTIRNLAAMAGFAALAAVAVIALPALVKASAPAPAEKSDLADTADCELRSWPYYARGCLRDESRNAGRAVNARLVTTDRLDGPVSSDTANVPNIDETANASAAPEAPADWMMSSSDVWVYIAAGDFIRRTVQ